YQGTSVFAGNPMLISPERLLTSGQLLPGDLADAPEFSADRVEYGDVITWKSALLDRAYARFRLLPGAAHERFRHFCAGNAPWLDDL
ncbi:4-alpha-glucanotransferase, partial [Salmonella enterica subsp. enterica serovar Minnesota]|uniref:4-alpha-glucanotransferase n=1 Tax=Salmonella enterica TaxID=28901 RepID=UPI003D267B36